MSDRYENEDVEVRRDGPLAAVIGIGAAALAIAYLTRATGSDGGWSGLGADGGARRHRRSLPDLVPRRAGAAAAGRPAGHPDALRALLARRRLDRGRADRAPARAAACCETAGSSVITGRDAELTLRLSLATRLVGADWDELTGALRDLAGATHRGGRAGAVPRRHSTPATDRPRRRPTRRGRTLPRDAHATVHADPPPPDRRRRARPRCATSPPAPTPSSTTRPAMPVLEPARGRRAAARPRGRLGGVGRPDRRAVEPTRSPRS